MGAQIHTPQGTRGVPFMYSKILGYHVCADLSCDPSELPNWVLMSILGWWPQPAPESGACVQDSTPPPIQQPE